MKADTIGIKLYAVYNNIREHTNSDKKFSPIINHDEHRIQQVLLNLQSNALKFTTKGEIKINVSILDKLQREDMIEVVEDNNNGENMFLKISVEDTGVGIKPQD